MSRLYCTADEFTNWPTGLDLQNLIPNGSAQEQAAQLRVVLESASSYVDQIVYQPLRATQSTEYASARPDPYGRLEVRVKRFPVTSVALVPALLSAQWRQTTRSGWLAVPAANITLVGNLLHQYLIDDRDYSVYGGWGLPPLTVQTTYVGGYPNPALTANAAAGATAIQVDDVTGLQDGTALTIYDIAGGQEDVLVQSVSGSTVTLASGLSYAHVVGVRASALPAAVTMATINIAAWIIKGRRAGGGIVMNGQLQPMQVGESEDMQQAMKLLAPFIRRV